jgi:hypothetical protein
VRTGFNRSSDHDKYQMAFIAKEINLGNLSAAHPRPSFESASEDRNLAQIF